MKFVSRDEEILRISASKSVLHLGCVGFTDLSTDERVSMLSKTLHHKLFQVSSNLVGLDYSKDVIKEIKEFEAFNNIYYADAENLNELSLDSAFDVVVIGDLIEHLSNPGKMLEGVKSFCSEDTKIIITTPNAFGANSYLKYIVNQFKEGNEHVLSFNRYNIRNLLYRFGYEIDKLYYCYQDYAKSNRFFSLFKSLINIFPKFGGTIFIVASIKKKN